MILLILFSIFSLYLFHHLYWKRRGLPPGPTPLPLFGNIMALGMPAPGYDAFCRWTKKYGDVYTFWMGSEPFIMINTLEKMKETFVRNGEVYMNKKAQEIQMEFRDGIFGIVETSGELWRDHRRFALSTLRDFGLGKDLMQEKILIEVQEMNKEFDRCWGQEVDVPRNFDLAVGNMINQLTFGHRFDGKRKEKFLELLAWMDESNRRMSKLTSVMKMFVPSLKYILGKDEPQEKSFKDEFFGFFSEQIEEHRKTVNLENEESLDYVEAYFKEQKKREAEGDFESFSNHQLKNTCCDLWLAGLLTTANTLSWGFAYLLNTPGIEKKIHEELDRVIGSDRLITTADRNDLTYINAFVNEVQRCANIFPLALWHETTRDTTLNGYKIPQGTGVIAQISVVMLDEKAFPEPYKFNPDRFIENGKLKKIEEFIPFSIGRRQCLGEGLARMELFLFTANFLNRYIIRPSSEGPPCIDKSKESLVQPRIFKAVLKKRFL